MLFSEVIIVNPVFIVLKTNSHEQARTSVWEFDVAVAPEPTLTKEKRRE